MSRLYIDNYIIETPLLDIINDIKSCLTNGKLRDVTEKADEIICTCPNDAHSGGTESHPDCHINLVETGGVQFGYFHCFACSASGPFYHFVALCFSISDIAAKKWLTANYGELAFEKVAVDDFIQIGRPASAKQYLDKTVLEQYQDWCPYLQQRGLSIDICKKFHVKYDPKYRQVLFPVFDEHDNLLMIPKRSIDTKVFYMDKNIEKPVYGLNVIKKNHVTKCMLVEGPIDLLTCWSKGVPAIAILGSPSDEQIMAINNSGLQSIYITTDNDAAGEKFALVLSKKLYNTILKTRVQLPAGRKDVNDLTNDEWEILIKKYNL